MLKQLVISYCLKDKERQSHYFFYCLEKLNFKRVKLSGVDEAWESRQVEREGGGGGVMQG